MLDCLVVGAGPAGGQCARQLARSDLSVLLIDRLPSLEANPFSSGGAPISIMEQFDLPKSVVGSEWRGLRFLTDRQERLWSPDEVGGVVLDFAKLREFLAEEVEAEGGKVALGTPYRSHEVRGDHLVVQAGKEKFETRWLVDATGSERRVLAKGVCKRPIEAVGIEQLVEVDSKIYEAWSDTLSFFMPAQSWHWQVLSKGGAELLQRAARGPFRADGGIVESLGSARKKARLCKWKARPPHRGAGDRHWRCDLNRQPARL